MQRNNRYEAAVAPLQKAGIELLVGEEVFKLLSDEEVLRGWDSLYQSCPWATAFQSKEFVATWYRTYRNEYLPILVKAEDESGLTGLLTMAVKIPDSGIADLSKKKVRIVGAGQFEAEYQVWLATVDNSNLFIKAALTEIRKHFPYSDILFRYIPPQASLDWIREDPQWQKLIVVEPFRRPLMDMSDPDLSKLFRKSEYRNKLNRLKRLGELSLERITDRERFSTILKDLTLQFDFRQGAMFNKNRFRENPLKAEFLLAMFEQNLLHATVLKVNEEVVASIVAVAGRDWVYLGGINTHTPFYAGFYSPGFVHFMLLGQQLAQEGIAVFDLTPGGDSYKERMATTHDYVYEMTVANNPSYRLKRLVKKQVHTGLIKAGKRPMAVELSAEKWLYLLKARLRKAKEKGLLVSVKERLKSKKAITEQRVYVIHGKPIEQKASFAIQKNSLGDLLDFDQKGAPLTRWEFLEDAMRRFEDGGVCYTWAESGQLRCCAWLRNPKSSTETRITSKFNIPDGAAVLYGIYVHPAGRESMGAFLRALSEEVSGNRNTTPTCVIADASDTTLCETLDSLGFGRVE
ncbi:hypothetical protein OB13_10520 [Pontibacter sp. HJ8]